MTFLGFVAFLLRTAFGLAFAGGILAFLWRRIATVRWRPLAEYYGRSRETPRDVRRMQTLIIHGVGPAFESYRGIVSVGLCDTGITLCLLPPFSVFHTPLFIPFSDISAMQRQWFLFKAVEITARKAPKTKFVVCRELWAWIEQNANERSDNRYYSSSATYQLSLR